MSGYASELTLRPRTARFAPLAGAGLRRIERWLEAERDQLGLWLPVALGAGIALWLMLPDRSSWLAAMAGLAGVALMAPAIGLDRRVGRAVGVAACTALLGMIVIWTRADWVAAPRIDRPVVAQLVGRIEAVDPHQDGGATLTVRIPDALEPLVVQKGSIAIDGVSLTVAGLDGPEIRIALIPHTLAATTLGAAAVGDPVNIEVDMIGRYVAHLMERSGR